ncbi:hypothetical protein ACHAQH_009150 [Verticillium albo-atrum]
MFRPPFYDCGPRHHDAYDQFLNHGYGFPGVNVNNYHSYNPGTRPSGYHPSQSQDSSTDNLAIFNNPYTDPHYRHLSSGLTPLTSPHLHRRCTVILPSGERALLDRHHLLALLPRTRNAPNAGRSSVFNIPSFLADYASNLNDIPQEDFDLGFNAALTFVIRHVEAISLNRNRALFTRQRALLANISARDQPALVSELFQHALFVCCALDQDRALGCSEGLGLEVVKWLLELLPRVQLHGPLEGVVYLFVGFARVFRATTGQITVLGRFWNALEEEERGVINGIMGEGVGGEGRGGNTARVLQALRGLRDAGAVE